MPIPKQPPPLDSDAAREKRQNRYIRKAGQGDGGDKKYQMLLEFDSDMVDEVDDARKPFGLSRSAWIRTAIREKLNREQS